MNKIICGDCLEKMKDISDNSVDLVVADPPYWKVVGETWDYQWRTESDYVDWSLKWMAEVSRVLRYGGTFYCFGYFRTLALIVPHLEGLGLELRQQIIIDKGMRSVSGRATKNYKMFPNVTESILFMIKDNKKMVKPFLKSRQTALNLSSKEINERLGVKSNGDGMWSTYTGRNVCEQFPTEELWNKLSNVLEFDLPYKNVWNDIDFYKEERFHPTQKPIKLIDRLVLASSNEGDLVLDPFLGCGSTALSEKGLGRNFIGIEMNADYCKVAEKRLDEIGERIERKLF